MRTFLALVFLWGLGRGTGAGHRRRGRCRRLPWQRLRLTAASRAVSNLLPGAGPPSLIPHTGGGPGAAEHSFLEEAFAVDPQRAGVKLGEELGLSGDEVYRMAEGCGVSLAKLQGGSANVATELSPLTMAAVLWLLGTRSATMETIASCLGICSKTLQRRMRDAGIPSRHACVEWTDEELAAVILHQSLYMGFGDTGVTFTDGARLIGLYLFAGGVSPALGGGGGPVDFVSVN